MSVKKISDSAFVLTHNFPWPVNSLLIRMPNGEIVICNAPFHQETSERTYRWIKEYLGEGAIIVLNTDYTLESVGGNAFYIDKGFKIFGTNITDSLVRSNQENEKKRLIAAAKTADQMRAYQQLNMIAANNTITATEDLRMSFGTVSFEMIDLGEAATPDQSIVHFPELQLVYAGRLVSGKDSPVVVTPISSVEGWRSGLDQLRKLNPQLIIPLFGKPGGAELISYTEKNLNSPSAE